MTIRDDVYEDISDHIDKHNGYIQLMAMVVSELRDTKDELRTIKQQLGMAGNAVIKAAESRRWQQ